MNISVLSKKENLSGTSIIDETRILFRRDFSINNLRLQSLLKTCSVSSFLQLPKATGGERLKPVFSTPDYSRELLRKTSFAGTDTSIIFRKSKTTIRQFVALVEAQRVERLAALNDNRGCGRVQFTMGNRYKNVGDIIFVNDFDNLSPDGDKRLP